MATQARLENEKEDRRRLILNNALLLFRQNGLGGTTIRQIAQASGLAVGTIYLYFADKTRIFCALLIEGYDLLISYMEESACTDSPEEKISQAIDRYFSFAFANPEYFSLIFYTVQSRGQGVLDVADRESGIYAALQKRKEYCLKFVKRHIRGLRPDLPEDELENAAEAVWSMLAGIILFFGKDGKERFASISRQAKKMILNSLTPTL